MLSFIRLALGMVSAHSSKTLTKKGPECMASRFDFPEWKEEEDHALSEGGDNLYSK